MRRGGRSICFYGGVAGLCGYLAVTHVEPLIDKNVHGWVHRIIVPRGSLGSKVQRMPNLTNSEENRLLDTSLDGTYLALYTTAPAEDGTGGVEISGNGYARQLISFGAASGGQKQNNADILFPAATGAQGTIVAYGILSAVTGGTIRWHRTLTVGEQRTIASGDQYRITSGVLTFTLD